MQALETSNETFFAFDLNTQLMWGQTLIFVGQSIFHVDGILKMKDCKLFPFFFKPQQLIKKSKIRYLIWAHTY